VVGLVFDGNIHSLGGDYGFDPATNRTVAVTSSALLEAMGKVYGADRPRGREPRARGDGRGGRGRRQAGVARTRHARDSFGGALTGLGSPRRRRCVAAVGAACRTVAQSVPGGPLPVRTARIPRPGHAASD